MTEKKEKSFRRPSGGERPLRRKPKLPLKRREEKPAAKAFEGERVAKVMARAGVCSRRDAEEWIAQGRVAVNGRALTGAAVNVRASDKITVDGKPMASRERTRLFLFHKPRGLVTTAKDPQGRETVFDYLRRRHPGLPRLVSVGRLDVTTEGLLLLTNDGGLARTLELPATGWARRYRVRAHGAIDQARLDELREGVTVGEVHYAPIEARLDRAQGANVWLTMALREGKNREVKRVLEHLGLAVNRLIRVSFGPFQLGDLGEGEVQETALETLREQLGHRLAEQAGVDFSSPVKPPPPGERERPQRGPRKHVSALRTEREESREKGPETRIERAETSDRKGRVVTVERIVSAQEPKETRKDGARRFPGRGRKEGAPPPARASSSGSRSFRGKGKAAAGVSRSFDEERRALPFARSKRAGEGWKKGGKRSERTNSESSFRSNRRPPKGAGAPPRKPGGKGSGKPRGR